MADQSPCRAPITGVDVAWSNANRLYDALALLHDAAKISSQEVDHQFVSSHSDRHNPLCRACALNFAIIVAAEELEAARFKYPAVFQDMADMQEAALKGNLAEAEGTITSLLGTIEKLEKKEGVQEN